MARILVGWEMGSELGHLEGVVAVGRALRDRGHDVTISLKELWRASGRTDLDGFQIVQSPVWMGRSKPTSPPPPRSVADALFVSRLDDVEQLTLYVRAWRTLMDLLRPDLVLAQSAPVLLLASRGRCPSIPFGGAYGIPPAGRPIAPCIPIEPHEVTDAARSEALVLPAFDRVDRLLGNGGIAHLSDLLSTDGWVCNLPELDPYAALRATPAQGPLRLPSVAIASGSARRPTEHVFVYAKSTPRSRSLLKSLFQHLAVTCDRLELYVSNAPDDMRTNAPAHVTIHTAPIDLAARLQEFTTVVHFGGHNLTSEALLAGVPQLLVPQHIEQMATASAVERLGVGFVVRTSMDGKPFTERDMEEQGRVALQETLPRFYEAPKLGELAGELGEKLRRVRKPSLDGLLALCEEKLSSPA